MNDFVTKDPSLRSDDLYLKIDETIIAVKYIVSIDTNDQEEAVILLVDGTEYTFGTITFHEIEEFMDSNCDVRCLR